MWNKLLVVVLVCGGVAAAQDVCRTIVPDASDGVTASPENHTVLFENADVRVIEVHSAAHTREAVHTHVRPGVMYTDQQGAGTYNTPDGKGDKSHPDDPAFKYRIFPTKPEGPHWTVNTGDTPFHAIRVELKHPGCGLAGWKPAAPGPDDAMVAAPQAHTVLFENDEMRVLDVHLAPHAKDVFHTHPWPSVFYVVQGQPTRQIATLGTEGVLRKFPPGVKILPTPPEAHQVENLGDGELHLIRFELKYGSGGK